MAAKKVSKKLKNFMRVVCDPKSNYETWTPWRNKNKNGGKVKTEAAVEKVFIEAEVLHRQSGLTCVRVLNGFGEPEINVADNLVIRAEAARKIRERIWP